MCDGCYFIVVESGVGILGFNGDVVTEVVAHAHRGNIELFDAGAREEGVRFVAADPAGDRGRRRS